MTEFGKRSAMAVMQVNEQYAIIFCIMAGLLLLWRLRSRNHKHVPPGTLGLPLIGETFEFARAHKKDRSRDWIEKRIAKYGPIFKTSLRGCPAVVMTGREANKFLFSNDSNTIVHKLPDSRILGKYSLAELNGEDHKRLRSAIMAFLRPEALQKYLGRMESVIEKHLDEYWKGYETVTVVPLMKRLTFDVACTLLFGVEEGELRNNLIRDFTIVIKGIWSLPLNFPGTVFHQSLNARSRICKCLSPIIRMRKIELERGKISPTQDLISCLLTIKMDGDDRPLSEEEIIDTIIFLMIASRDTTSTLLSFLVMLLAKNPTVHHNIVQEHMGIIASKQPGEALTWDDVQKMQYTWRVAQETLRMTPPVIGGFRKAVKDFQYGSYTIPEGWQLLWVACSTHMNSEIFADADKFDPGRFDKHRASVPLYSFVAFGAGSRICAGYDFAKVETVLAMHHLVTKYKWSLVIPDEPIMRDPMACPAMGLPVRLQPVKPF